MSKVGYSQKHHTCTYTRARYKCKEQCCQHHTPSRSQRIDSKW